MSSSEDTPGIAIEQLRIKNRKAQFHDSELSFKILAGR